MNSASGLVAYVDIDDTLVRSFGSKRIAMPAMAQHIRELHAAGIVLFAWSTAGADYARAAAADLGLDDCFRAFLPKPHIIIDDQPPAAWRRLIHVHPAEASAKTPEDYVAALTHVAG